MRLAVIAVIVCFGVTCLHAQDDKPKNISLGGIAKAIVALAKFKRLTKKAETCYVGIDGNYTETNCNEHETRCLTKIEINHDLTKISKHCKEAEPCKNLERVNGVQCFGKQARANEVRICHYCCKDSLCNDNDSLRELEKERKKGN